MQGFCEKSLKIFSYFAFLCKIEAKIRHPSRAGLVLGAFVRYNKKEILMGWCWPLNGLLFSATQIMQYICRALVVLLTIPFHESAHALVSHFWGMIPPCGRAVCR